MQCSMCYKEIEDGTGLATWKTPIHYKCKDEFIRRSTSNVCVICGKQATNSLDQKCKDHADTDVYMGYGS